MHPDPYETTNGALALALALTGHEPIDLWNEYTPEQLEKLARSLGMDKVTAREAWQVHGKPGTIRYIFGRSPELLHLIAAYEDERGRVRNGEPGSTLEVTAEDVVRIVATALGQRAAFADLWKKVTPKLRVNHAGEPERIEDPAGNGFRIRYPGFTTLSINAPAEDLAKLNR
jgi:hypothetical protein